MAYNAIDIAKKIVCNTDVEHGDTLSNLKLQKLLYYMQGFHLAFFDEPFLTSLLRRGSTGLLCQLCFKSSKNIRNALSILTTITMIWC